MSAFNRYRPNHAQRNKNPLSSQRLRPLQPPPSAQPLCPKPSPLLVPVRERTQSGNLRVRFAFRSVVHLPPPVSFRNPGKIGLVRRPFSPLKIWPSRPAHKGIPFRNPAPPLRPVQKSQRHSPIHPTETRGLDPIGRAELFARRSNPASRNTRCLERVSLPQSPSPPFTPEAHSPSG